MILFDNHSQVADNTHMIERSLSKLFDYGTPIPTTLDELSDLLIKIDEASAVQITRLQHLLFIEDDQQHATDEIVMILFAMEEPVRALVVNFIDKHAWSANLPESDWRKIKDQVQTAKDLEGSVDSIRDSSDLNNQISLLRTLPRNLVFKHTANISNGHPETETTAAKLALALDNLLTLLTKLDKMRLALKPSNPIQRVFKRTLLNIRDGIPSDENSQNQLISEIDRIISQLPPNYEAAIRTVKESITKE